MNEMVVMFIALFNGVQCFHVFVSQLYEVDAVVGV
jgi:hypothetical protein